ncbi:hypothetical protein RHS01_10435 [Rhizoctonia solani]|uniref:RING-type domain-containing protein n=1 Tax=Rhizoctonia solani TaxID=456999 RepID=A0A8H7I574_9AGAM|nr:hypothetical protein RHS01_10435 [Rhizoctonia solani]
MSKMYPDNAVTMVDDTPAGDRSRNTYLTECGHVICAMCYNNVKILPRPCGGCGKDIDHRKVIRVYFHEVCGSNSEEVESLERRIKRRGKRETELLRQTKDRLRERLEELTGMVEASAQRLENAIQSTVEALRSTSGGSDTL